MRRYGLLPDRLAQPFARWLPPAEVVAGVLLLAGAAIRPAAFAAAVLLTAFTGAVALALLRGREIDCGCFAAVARRRMTWLTVVRNLVLTAAGLVLVWRAPSGLSIDELILGGKGVVSDSEAIAIGVATTAALAAGALVQANSRLASLISRSRAAGVSS